MRTYIKDIYKCLIFWGFRADYVKIAHYKEDPVKFTVSNKVAIERGVKDGKLYKVRSLQSFLDGLNGPNHIKEEWERHVGEEDTTQAKS